MKKHLIWIFIAISLFLVSCTEGTSVTTSVYQTDTTLISSTTQDSTTTQTSAETSTQTTIQTTTIPITTQNTTTEITTIPVEDTIATISGIEDTNVILGHYFNVMNDVSAESEFGTDITAFVNVSGAVDFGSIGTYQLHYYINYNGDTLSATRTINVINGTYIESNIQRPVGLNGIISAGEGSYYTGSNSSIAHPVNPNYLANNLLVDAIPSSGWWTSLLVQNYGGGNGIYTNPLRVAFSNEGMEITNPQDGFVQYWNVNDVQTIAQFPIAIKDLYLKSSDLNLGYVTEVIDYSDNSVKVAMRNNGSNIDEVVVSLVQGSPYIFAETENLEALTIAMESGALVEFYDLAGNLINANSHSGDAIIIKYVHRHSGYDNAPPATVGQPEYSDKYYLVNTPLNTVFTMNNNVLSMSLGDGNFISVVAINDLSEAAYYHNHGYNLINNSITDFQIDYQASMVYTDYLFNTQSLRTDLSMNTVLALMPHHYKYSDASLTEYSYRTVRGTLKVMEGNYFQTELSFNGLLPGYTLPDNSEYSETDLVTYLNSLNTEIDTQDPDGFYNNEGPYWNSKALYPLAQGIIIANQAGETAIEFQLIAKLRTLLVDWFTYSNSSDEKFLFYNNAWGSVYYSNDDFATASTLSDHSFTHGYLIYAASVLAMYDSSFVTDYADMVDLLLDDYMYPTKNSSDFQYLRNFDAWAGHSWAHGFGTFAEGNNLESTSEALNSWNAGYLWALATEDTERMEAAIYGFVTEISAIKEYWFDYDEENWDPKFGDYVDVAGMIWGGKHDYATWFGANPTFIYGIQWLPTGEYLTNYALNDDDYTKFSSIYATYLAAKDGVIDTWYSNMWAIQAIVDSSVAIQEFDSTKILNDDYTAELVGTYWMIHALESLGRRNSDIWMEIQIGVSSTVYITEDETVYAMIWNVSDESKTVNFYDSNGLYDSVEVSSNSFTKVELN
ncbi:MAG: DUF5011 domain-containing protein [Tenericutes bacterium]|nr:DUF5011 domain-containing protein [Mycoplasmatota bacterium]